MDLSGKVTEEQMQEARERRSRIEQPLEADPGMGGDNDWGPAGDDLFGSGGADDPFSSGGGSSWGGGGGSSWGSGGGGWGSDLSSPGFGAPAASAAPAAKSTEDKLFDGMKLIFTGFFTFFGELVKSFKEFDAVSRVQVGRTSVIISVIMTVIGLVLLLFGKGIGLSLVVGSILALAAGVMLFMFAYDAVAGGAEDPALSNPVDPFSDLSSEDTDESFDSGDISWGGGSSTWEEGTPLDIEDLQDEEDIYSDNSTSGDLSAAADAWAGSAFAEPEVPKKFTSPDEILETVPSTLLSREYLYGVMREVLPLLKPDFDKKEKIDPDSAVFSEYDSFVQAAANRCAPASADEDDALILKDAEDSLMFLLLVTSRPKWVKTPSKIAEELQIILQYDPKTGKKNPHLMCTADAVGDQVYFKITKEEVATVSVGDIYKSQEARIKDSRIKIPIVMGLDENGTADVHDFSTINALLVAGKPRTGKSWVSLSIVAQMLMYKSPKEVQIYFCDPKGLASDFYSAATPHVKGFASETEDIFNLMRYVVNEEGARRREYIGGKGYQNIVDYRAEHPEDDTVPDIYLIVDEVISVVEQMGDDKRKEFNSLLKMLVSQLPGFGVRLFMLPHAIKHEVVNKTVTDLIPCRISVMGDLHHIEQTTGYKKFDRSLLNMGSMAVRFDSALPLFVQAAILTESNNGNKQLLDFLRRFWSKAYPDEVDNSVYALRQKEVQRLSVSREVVDLAAPSEVVVSQTDSFVVAAPAALAGRTEKSPGSQVLSPAQVDEILVGVHEQSEDHPSNTRNAFVSTDAPASDDFSGKGPAFEDTDSAFSDDELFGEPEGLKESDVDSVWEDDQKFEGWK